MTWTVAVPVKAAGTRKTRLAAAMDPASRDALVDDMLAHVLATLAAVEGVEVLIVSPVRPAGWAGRWHRDAGIGLNAALAAARAAGSPARFAVIHADLPCLTVADVRALLRTAEEAGLAVAADRHGRGTNAIAIADDRPFAFRFGADSLSAHAAAPGAVVLRRAGFGLDVDTSDDLALMRDSGIGSLTD